jgi:hypothetical protein
VRAREQQLADEREQHKAERAVAAKEALRQVERLATLQGERDAARQEAQAAREGAPKQEGQLEALRTHSAELAGLLHAFRGDLQEPAGAGGPQGGAPEAAPRRGPAGSG